MKHLLQKLFKRRKPSRIEVKSLFFENCLKTRKLTLELLEERDLLCASCGETESFCSTILSASGHEISEFSAPSPSSMSLVSSSEMVSEASSTAINFLTGETIILSNETVFSLHSKSDSPYRIYLDFTGHTTSGLFWNTDFNQGADIETPAYDFDGDPTTFSASELAAIYEIWQRVSEDYLPFNIDVTTDEPVLSDLCRSNSQDNRYGVRICIGGNSTDWYTTKNIGGVTGNGSFTSVNDTPGFVFAVSLLNEPEYVAESATHEAGHTFNLQHDGLGDGKGKNEYYSGDPNWAPIMGTGYYSALTQWSKGEYYNASNQEDDIQKIADYIGFRADDYFDNSSNATDLDLAALADGLVSVSGIIGMNLDQNGNSVRDIDFFKFTTEGLSGYLQIGGLTTVTNLDVLAKLYDSSGSLIEIFDPTDTLYVLVDLENLNGQYYLSIEGTGCGDLSTTGYSSYGSLGAYSIAVMTNYPDLAFVQPATWPDAVFLSSGKTKQTVFSSDETIRIYMAFTNSGNQTVSSDSISLKLYYNESSVLTNLSSFYSKANLSQDASGNWLLKPGDTVQCGFYVYVPNNAAYSSISALGTYTVKAELLCSVLELKQSNNIVEFEIALVEPWTTDFTCSAETLGSNYSAGALVGNFSAADCYSTDFTFALVDDSSGNLSNSLFSISDGELVLNQSYPSAGSCLIYVKATSSLGYSVSKYFTLTVRSEGENAPPIAVLSVSNSTPQLSTVVTLSAKGSCDLEDGTDLIYFWRIVNDQNETVTTFSTETVCLQPDNFASAGERLTVRLTVTDRQGKSSVTKTQSMTLQAILPEIYVTTRQITNSNLLAMTWRVRTYSATTCSNWTIDWGDTVETITCPAFFLDSCHYYTKNGTYSITLTIDERYTFSIGSYTFSCAIESTNLLRGASAVQNEIGANLMESPILIDFGNKENISASDNTRVIDPISRVANESQTIENSLSVDDIQPIVRILSNFFWNEAEKLKFRQYNNTQMEQIIQNVLIKETERLKDNIWMFDDGWNSDSDSIRTISAYLSFGGISLIVNSHISIDLDFVFRKSFSDCADASYKIQSAFPETGPKQLPIDEDTREKRENNPTIGNIKVIDFENSSIPLVFFRNEIVTKAGLQRQTGGNVEKFKSRQYKRNCLGGLDDSRFLKDVEDGVRGVCIENVKKSVSAETRRINDLAVSAFIAMDDVILSSKREFLQKDVI